MTTDPTTSPVLEEESLTPVRGKGGSMLDRWIDAGPEAALKRVETMVKTLEQLRLASIKATYPSDWIIHTSTDRDGVIISQRGYLQDTGAERAGKIWGIQIGAPITEREPASGTFDDGTFVYHMLAEAWSAVTGERLEEVQGSRWSGDPFFAKSVGPDERVDPTDVRKAAYANLHGRAVRALAGLNGVPLDTLKAAGIDPAKVVMVTYGKGAKGGESTGAAVGTGDVTVAFGKSAGKAPKELADADIAWYVKAYGENVADPVKARFAKANQRVLDALKAEQERRARKGEHEEATGKDESSAEAATGSGGRITAAEVTEFWRLVKAKSWEKAEVGSLLAEIGVASVDQIQRDGWDVVKATLERGPVRA